MANFVLRAGQFFCHPFGSETAPRLANPAWTDHVRTAALRVLSCLGPSDGATAPSDPAADLDWLSLSRRDPKHRDPYRDLDDLSLKSDERQSRRRSLPF